MSKITACPKLDILRIKEIAGVATTGLARTGSGTNFDKRVPKSDRCEFLQEERYLSLKL